LPADYSIHQGIRARVRQDEITESELAHCRRARRHDPTQRIEEGGEQ